MQAADIRKAFLDFFQGKEHLLVPSSSLIPAADPTLLLTSAGMVQFKPYFTGEMPPPSPRLTSVQKCFRVSDVDDVGDTSHLTFFEMLGNFSVGDYFRKEAIAWGYEFVTQHMGLAPEQLWATVFRDDDEAHKLWQETGIPAERIRRFGDEDNWWGPAGSEGPCGPCSEVHYDFGGACRLGKSDTGCGPNCECGRFLELWNLVFMQFYQDPEGKRTPLPNPNIDTGMGLERAAMILQGVSSIYETDLFAPIVQRIAELAGRAYGQDGQTDIAIRVVAEHTRAAAFLIADGVVPDNKGRGYVLRRIIRRAIRFGRKLGLESGDPSFQVPLQGEPIRRGSGFLPQVAEVVIQQMGSVYPELASGQDFVLRVLQLEEKQFGQVYEVGLNRISELVSSRETLKGSAESREKQIESGQLTPQSAAALLRIDVAQEVAKIKGLVSATENIARGFEQGEGREYKGESHLRATLHAAEKAGLTTIPAQDADFYEIKRRIGIFIVLSGDEVFPLYDTYGFPVEETAEIAREHGLEVDMEGFQREMEAQQQRSRAAGAKFGGDFDAQRVYQELGVSGTRFLGYETLSAPSVTVALLVNGVSSHVANEGQRVEVVLRETPFYAEGGGQVGDTGVIEAPGWVVHVEDTQSPIAGLIVHWGLVTRGTVQVGEIITAIVDHERRMDAARNHTATHLLHAALRQVLGTHVRQQGSLVTQDRLRFDFTHISPVTPEEMRTVEDLVNDLIRANVPVHKRETTYRQAVAEGALAFFGERYGDQVRVVEVSSNPSFEVPHYGEPERSEGGAGHAQAFSFEVCGGTHVNATGDIGYCHVLGESSIGAGLRRIEAVTGRAAETLVRDQQALLGRVAHQLEASPQDLESKVASLLDEVTRLRREASAQERVSSRQQAQVLLEQAQEVNGITVVSGIADVGSVEALREAGDWLRDKLGSGVVVLGVVVKERPTLMVMVTRDLVGRGAHAGNAVKEAAKVMGGGGGGRPEIAQAGGQHPDKLEEALRTAVEVVVGQVEGE